MLRCVAAHHGGDLRFPLARWRGAPLYLWRIDSRFKISEPKVPLRQMPSAYIRRNIAVTTAGVLST